MLDEGLIQETRNVIEKGLSAHWVVDQNVVYEAVISWIENGTQNRLRLIEAISHGIIAVALEQKHKYRQLNNVGWLPVSNVADAVAKILHEVVTD
jgi:tRNA A37 N6-isopentenylltransferase MiaA